MHSSSRQRSRGMPSSSNIVPMAPSPQIRPLWSSSRRSTGYAVNVSAPPGQWRVPGERINLRPRRRSSYLASKNDLFLVPGMRFTAMATGHSARLEISGNKSIFFNHHPGDIEFLCYRTSHQYSLDHSANIAHRRLKARAFLPSCRKISATLSFIPRRS